MSTGQLSEFGFLCIAFHLFLYKKNVTQVRLRLILIEQELLRYVNI